MSQSSISVLRRSLGISLTGRQTLQQARTLSHALVQGRPAEGIVKSTGDVQVLEDGPAIYSLCSQQ
eukprot:766727-Hanusia_phi.AAC.3